MKTLTAAILSLFLTVPALAGGNKQSMGAGESFVYSAVFGLAAYVTHAKAVELTEEAGRYRARAAFELDVKPTSYYQDHYFGLTSAAGKTERKSARLTTLSNGLGVIALSFFVRGVVKLDYDGDAVMVRKEWRF